MYNSVKTWPTWVFIGCIILAFVGVGLALLLAGTVDGGAMVPGQPSSVSALQTAVIYLFPFGIIGSIGAMITRSRLIGRSTSKSAKALGYSCDAGAFGTR